MSDVDLQIIIILSTFVICYGVVSAIVTKNQHWILLSVYVWTTIQLLSVYNPLSFKPVSDQTILVICGYLFTLTTSTAITYNLHNTKPRAVNYYNLTLMSVNRRFMKSLGWFLSIFYLVFLFRSLTYIMTNGLTAEYRMLALGFGTESVIFKNSFEAFFFLSILRGALIVYLCLSLYQAFKQKIYKNIIICSLLMTFDSIITFGRFFIYLFLISVTFTALLHRKNIFSIKSMLVLSTFFTFLYFLSSARFEDGLSLADVILRYVLAYHIYGVFLLDRVVTEAVQIEDWWGGAMLSGILFLINKFLDIFQFGFPVYLESKTAENLSELIYLGKSDDMIFYANAFYTMIAYMIIDGGYFGVFVTSIFVGVIYGKVCGLYNTKESAKSFSLFIIMILILFFAIIKNQFSQYYFVIALLFFAFAPTSIYMERNVE